MIKLPVSPEFRVFQKYTPGALKRAGSSLTVFPGSISNRCIGPPLLSTIRTDSLLPELASWHHIPSLPAGLGLKVIPAAFSLQSTTSKAAPSLLNAALRVGISAVDRISLSCIFFFALKTSLNHGPVLSGSKEKETIPWSGLLLQFACSLNDGWSDSTLSSSTASVLKSSVN